MREKKLPSQTLPDFQQYLLSRKLVPEKKRNLLRLLEMRDVHKFITFCPQRQITQAERFIFKCYRTSFRLERYLKCAAKGKNRGFI